MFRPIRPSELVDNSPSSPISSSILPLQNASDFTVTDISRPQNEHRQPQTGEHVGTSQQTHPHSLMDFSSLNTTNSLSIGRPSSAIVPATTAMSVSPAMSLNFHIGNVFIFD